MDSFGGKVRGRRTGIIFNNEMDSTSTPGSVNASSPSNYSAPGKMPMSSMSPSLVFDSSQRVVYMSGAAGGPKIITGTAFVSESEIPFLRHPAILTVITVLIITAIARRNATQSPGFPQLRFPHDSRKALNEATGGVQYCSKIHVKKSKPHLTQIRQLSRAVDV